MSATLFFVPDVSLGLQGPQDREHRRIGKFVMKAFAHLGYHRWTVIPKDLHDIGFAISEGNVHGQPTIVIVEDTTAPKAVNYICRRAELGNRAARAFATIIGGQAKRFRMAAGEASMQGRLLPMSASR
jgi:hypothetical protein